MAGCDAFGYGDTMTMPVFYTPKMVADSRAFSPSAAKPAPVVERLRALDVVVIEPPPATVEDFCRAHDRRFVEDVLACQRPNGFGNTSPEVAASLPYTTGAMLAAARHVRSHGGIACAPCSGFHHAGHDDVGGFCTFNGLMVTACALHAEGARRIGIVDCDQHYGDGTDEILSEHRIDWVDHFTAGADYRRPHQVKAFFAELAERIAAMRGCDAVLYQAGADPHVDDPLGGWLTTAELAARDALVFDTCVRLGLPVAWNLAGGYQVEADGSIPKVLEIHENTAKAALSSLSRRP
jgi:acetoin utilization deacetylase AcuC-like enzyme